MTDRAPIAIVGAGCVLPGGLDPASFGRRVLAGDDLVGRAPSGRWRVPPGAVLTEADRPDGDHAWCDRGGYVSGFDGVWDPSGFAVPAADLTGLDPLNHWLLHAGRQALDGVAHAGARAGTFVGNLSFPTEGLADWAAKAWAVRAHPSLASELGVADADPRDRFQSGLPVHRLAEALGLVGPAFALDAACASALYALALGVERLRSGEIDVALAGAVNRADDLFLHVGFTALRALSRSGRSRPFHAEADGLLPAEGAALFTLKRLDDARSDGDRILGVIREVGLSNDGRRGGILAPSADGQEAALRAAWAGLDPSTCGLLECHATGTVVGDGTELASASRVFGAGLAVGSVKSNLGHPITAAGGAALIKVLAGIEAGVRPPTLHAETPTSAVDEHGFRLVTEAEAWDGPRRAGVSAFGFGGNNAHLVVEAPDLAPTSVFPVAKPVGDVVVVGIGARVGQGTSAADLAAQVRGEGPEGGRTETVVVDVDGLRTPPRDLDQTLPQQLQVLEAAREALSATEVPATTAVLVGMGADAEVGRYGVRWRLADRLDGAALAGARDAVVPELASAGVVGTMPNIPANRIQAFLDVHGPGFTVSAEEASGLAALDLAVRWLRAGRVDAAVVGASDLATEPAQVAARRALGGEGRAGDAAVALVLKRRADAEAAGDRVLAVVDTDATPDAVYGPDGVDLGPSLGVAHAAWGLVQVAAGVTQLAGGHAQAVRIEVDPMGGARQGVTLSGGTTGPLPAAPTPVAPRSIPAHAPAVSFRALLDTPHASAPAPWLPPVSDVVAEVAPPPRPTPPSPVPSAAPPRAMPTPPTPVAASPASAHAAAHLGAAHQAYLQAQHAAHARFLALRAQAADLLIARRGQVPPGVVPVAPVPAPAPAPVAAPAPTVVPPAPTPATPATPAPSTVAPAPVARRLRPAAELPGPTLDRADLRVHAAGAISTIYGDAFATQDGFHRQVRMPRPPLLLADRVTGIDAEPKVLGKGVLWSETDVGSQRWYLHAGHMPAGVMIEAGQADLMLISWMGIDDLNRSDRVYRLLGCTLTYRGGLPADGDTLHYEIHMDGHAQHDAIRLMFFHYDCVDQHGQPRLEVRGGQAGFFTDAELDDSAGVLWTPEEGDHDATARLDGPDVVGTKTSFTRDDLLAFASGDAFACFGPGWERAAAHVQPPTIQAPPELFLHTVDVCDPAGGPWGRGYLKARQPISPDDWFFDGHFHHDPCMPGTLMFEGCLQALAFYLASMGFTIPRDGWRFEPVPDESIDLRCRGQCLPSNREVVYEVFVEEVHAGPVPTVYADLLCTVDGLKAFHARRCGLRLVPDWPLAELGPVHGSLAPDPEPVASGQGIALGRHAALGCAWGKPSDAFGAMYAPFDDGRYVPRLPSPPFLFLSRVLDVDGPGADRRVGSRVTTAWDVPADAWFCDAQGGDAIPFCVLLEAALQPCGWLASYAGSILGHDEALFFRNLDGTATLHATPGADLGTLHTDVTMTRLAESGGMIIEAFDVVCTTATGERIWDLQTVFGFFPTEALANQVGIPVEAKATAFLEAEAEGVIDLRDEASLPPGPPLGLGRLAILDRVSGLWPTGGEAGLGRLRVEMDVDPRAWFFRAHFFQDPVQPGSLGLEAMVRAFQAFLRLEGHAEGMTAPRFLPLVAGRELKWTYRGQVRPEKRRVTVTADVTELVVTDGRVEIVGTADLWCDGLRIYRAEGVSTAVVDDGVVVARPAATAILGPDDDPTPWWRAHLEGAPLAGLLGPASARFLPDVHAVDPEALRAGRPMVFLANHQTAFESVAFATRLAAWLDKPVAVVAKADHADAWLGRLLTAGFAWPGAGDAPIVYVDRDDAVGMAEAIAGIRDAVVSGEMTLLVHASGTRAHRGGQPLRTVSSAFLDLALDVGADVVPVRFAGGLPADELPTKQDLPVGVGPTRLPNGVGAQSAWIGAPLAASELAALPLPARKAAVVDAVGRLGPLRELERPVAGDVDLTAEGRAWAARAEVPEVLGVLAALWARTAEGVDAEVLAAAAGAPTDDAALAALADVLGGTRR